MFYFCTKSPATFGNDRNKTKRGGVVIREMDGYRFLCYFRQNEQQWLMHTLRYGRSVRERCRSSPKPHQSRTDWRQSLKPITFSRTALTRGRMSCIKALGAQERRGWSSLPYSGYRPTEQDEMVKGVREENSDKRIFGS